MRPVKSSSCQRAMVSTSRGHHWIIEDCTVRWANGVGIDIGNQFWGLPQPPAHVLPEPQLQAALIKTGHDLLKRPLAGKALRHPGVEVRVGGNIPAGKGGQHLFQVDQPVLHRIVDLVEDDQVKTA